MNLVLTAERPQATAEIRHSVLAYDSTTEALTWELPVPLFLDTLVLKLAGVPPEDRFGALSYPLDAEGVDVIRFLLAPDVDLSRQEHFLEATAGRTAGLPIGKVEAFELMAELAPHPRYGRSARVRISERELVLPVLRLLDESGRGWEGLGELAGRLAALFGRFDGLDEGYFLPKVRDMISHRAQPSSFIGRGLAYFERDGLCITDLGRSTVGALLA